jgi:hypothetical protein
MLLHATMPWYQDIAPLYSFAPSFGPLYYASSAAIGSGMAQHNHQGPSSGPGPNRAERMAGRRKARAQKPYQRLHESLRPRISRDHLATVHPADAWMGSNNPGGGTLRPLPWYLSTFDSNSAQQPIERQDLDHHLGPSKPSKTLTRDIVDPLIYEIPVIELESKFNLIIAQSFLL